MFILYYNPIHFTEIVPDLLKGMNSLSSIFLRSKINKPLNTLSLSLQSDSNSQAN